MGLPIKSLFMKSGAGPAPGGSLNGCLGYTPLSVSVAPMPCIAEQYDNGNWHDILLNTDRFIVPSGVSLIKLCGSIPIASGASVGTAIGKKAGADFFGQMRRGIRATANNVDASTGYSAVLAVSPGDYFGVQPSAGTAANNYAAYVGIEALDAATKYALVGKTSTQAIGSGAATILTWDSEAADTSGFHDNVSQNSRLTVPSGITRVKLSCNIGLASAFNVQCSIELYKNGALVSGGFRHDFGSNGAIANNVGAISPTLEVLAGDYFEVRYTGSPAVTVNNADQTWFCIEEAPIYDRSLAVMSSTQNINVTPVVLTWGATLYNGAGAYSGGAPTRLTVPAGKTFARVGFNAINASVSGSMRLRTLLNGTNFVGEVTLVCDSDTADALNGMTPWVPVVPGDYFEIEATASGAQVIQNAANTWFFAEFI